MYLAEFRSAVRSGRFFTFLRMGLFLTALCGLSPSPIRADDNVLRLLKRIPESANSLAIIRVQEILQSPRAVRESWKDPQGENFLLGAGVVPPWVDELVVGSQVRIGGFNKDWSVALLVVPPQFSLEGLARRENAHVEELGGLRAVRGRRDAYFVDLKDRVLGVMSPAYRQDVARWARRATAEQGGVSEYLTKASTTSAQILLALDVQDAYDSIAARDYLSSQKILEESKVTLVSALELLRSLRGVRVLAIINDQTEAKIALDFTHPIDLPVEVIKTLTVNAIYDQGLHIPELADSKTSLSGQTFVLTMPNLSDESLRMILSLIITAVPERPAKANDSGVSELANKDPLARPTSPTTAGTRSSNVADLDATKHYLDTVNRIVGDLERNLNRANDYIRTATWHDNFAAKIERLPVSGVTIEASDYGLRMSTRLRALAASLRGVAIKVNTQEGTLVYNTYVNPGYEYYGPWGGIGYQPANINVTSNLQAVRERQAIAITAGAEQRAQIWQMMIEDRNQMVRNVRVIETTKPVIEAEKPQ